MRRTGLVVVHASDELYGADRMVLEVLAAAPTHLRAEVWLPTDLAHPALRLCEEIERAGTPTRHLRLPILRRAYRTTGGLAVLLLRAVSLWGRLLARRPAMIYCTSSAAMLSAPLARLAGVPLVVGHVQEIWDDGDRALLSPVTRACHVLVCISEAVRLSLPPRLHARAVVVPNAAPAPPVRVGLAGRAGPLSWVVASRWTPRKGHATLLAAWDRCADPGHLTVLGGPPGSGASVDVAALVADLRRPDTVTIAGEVADIGPFIDAADVVLVPSDEPEGFGLIAIEASARARAVVASAAGGLTEAVDHDVTGWLYPMGDVDALAGLISSLDRDDAARAGSRGREKYERLYTPAAFGERWRKALSL